LLQESVYVKYLHYILVSAVLKATDSAFIELRVENGVAEASLRLPVADD
jgi:hypothetical protein